MSVATHNLETVLYVLSRWTEHAKKKKLYGTDQYFVGPYMDDLGNMCGISDCTARKAVNELFDKGQIDMVRGRPMLYTINNKGKK